MTRRLVRSACVIALVWLITSCIRRVELDHDAAVLGDGGTVEGVSFPSDGGPSGDGRINDGGGPTG